jgi:peroxiredoxin
MHIINGMNCELVFLVNGGREEHKIFRDTFKIRPQILIDDDGKVGEAYDIYGVNTHDMNRDDYKNYTAPSVYLIDSEGNVSCFWILSGPRGRPSPECILGILSLAKDSGWKY